MSQKLFALKTDSSVLEAIERAASKPVSADELREQRVSFVFASLDKDSNMTREQVRREIEKQDISAKD